MFPGSTNTRRYQNCIESAMVVEKFASYGTTAEAGPMSPLVEPQAP